jgi:hypothetical protein
MTHDEEYSSFFETKSIDRIFVGFIVSLDSASPLAMIEV